MDSENRYSTELRYLLGKLRRRTIALQSVAGFVSFIAMGAWLFLALVVWTAVIDEPQLWKTTLVSRLAVVALFGTFVWLVVWPILRIPRLDALANEVEKRKDLRELLRAGFEFSQDGSAARRYSPALVKEVIHRAVNSIDGLQVRYLFLSRKDIALLPLAYGGLLVLLLIAIFNPSLFVNAGKRVSSPAAASAVEHHANIHVSPGNITVLAGSDVTVAGLDFGKSEDGVFVSFNLSEDFWKTEPTNLVPGADPGLTGGGGINRYEYSFNDLRHTVSYFFQAGDYKSTTCTITVVHKPTLTDLDVTLTPPAYTGEPAFTLKDYGGNVQALEGTGVSVKGRANNNIAAARVRFNNGKSREVEFSGQTVFFEFQALEDGFYSVILEDAIGHKTDDPLVYTIEVFQDHAPSLDVLEPGGDTTMPRTQRLALGFVASDDYGVQRASLHFRKSGETEFTRTNIPIGDQHNRKEIAVAWEWDLGDLRLFPGNYIEYYVQVSDNNVVTGPGVARSRMFQIVVPTMAELYDRVRDEEARRGDLFEEAIKESEDFRERLEKITREYIKTEKMEWSQKKEIDKALDRQKAVEGALDDIKQSLDETMRELSENQMTSQQIGEKLEEIRELLEEINSKELREYMEELKQSMEKMSPEDIKEALENINMNAREMLEKLERTANLLKQLQREQQMEEIVRKSQDLMQSQKELAEKTADADAKNQQEMNELSEQQADLAKKADQLKKSMEDFSEEMQDADADVSKQMQETSQQLNQEQGPQKNMRKASESLQMSQQQQAMEQQQEAMDKLISLFRKSNEAQQAMSANSGRKMSINLQKYAKQTLDLSFKQEQLAEDLRADKSSDRTVDFQELAQTQNSYLKATEKIANEILSLSSMSLSIPRELMEALGTSVDRMQNSVLFLEQNRPFMSTAHANNAVESLNKATIELLRSAKQCSSQGSSGQMSAQQMLQQMIPQQQDILQQTKSMMELQATAEKLLQERQAQLDRMSGEQRSLRDLAEDIEKSMNQNQELLGRMDRTVEEMEEVSRAIERGEINEDLVRREQRILSRLLDAQRSLHTRDYEQKRESITAEEIFSKSLGNKPPAPESRSLREEIRRAMQLKAPGEFEDLIKLYFRALAEESAVQGGGS
jgi:hypothetical protein